MAKVQNSCFSIRPPADRTMSEMKRIKLRRSALFWARGILRSTGEREGGIWRERETYFSQNVQVISKWDAKMFGSCYVSNFEFAAGRALLLGIGKYRSGVNKTHVPSANCQTAKVPSPSVLVTVGLLVVAHVLSAEVRLVLYATMRSVLVDKVRVSTFTTSRS